jgi:hypothetical protein
MATVDELIVQIKADTKDLNKKLKQTNKQLEKTGKEAKQAGTSMKGAFSTGKIAVVAATAAMVKSVSSIAKVGMQFEDLKDSLDQVFGSMQAGDAAMQNVFKFAQTTPFQIEDATKAFIALKSAGIEPSMDMLQTFADTASVSVDQLGTFEALIRMVQRSASGGMGLEELNMISDRGIDVLGILGEKLNLTKDDIAKFGKTADGAAKMVKALTEGLQEKFGGAMEAKMDNLSTKTSNMTIAFKLLANDVFESGLGDFLKEMADSLTSFADGILRARMAARGEIFPNMENILALGDPNQRLAALNAQIKIQERAQAANEGLLENLSANARDSEIKQILQERVRFEKMIANMLQMRVSLEKEVGKAKKDSTDKTLSEDQISLQNQFNKLFQDTIPEYDKLQIKIDTLRESLAAGTLDAKKGAAVLEHLQALQDELGETSEFTQAMEDAITSSAHAFTKDFVDSLLEGQSALEGFKNFARNIVSQIITIFLQMEVVNRILGAIFPNFQGQQGTGLFDFQTKQGMGIDASLNMGVQAAGGKTLQAGVPALVGERGAEIFVPNSGGTMMNNMNSKNAMGGGTVIVNQSVNFATGVVPTVRAEVQKMLPQISDVTKGAVLEAAVRGGSFRKGLQGRG